MLITGSQLARELNLTRQTISKACLIGSLIKNQNNKIDLSLDLNAEYVRDHGFNPENFNDNENSEKHVLSESKKDKMQKVKNKEVLTKIIENDKNKEKIRRESEKLGFFVNTDKLSGELAEELLNTKFKDVLKEFGTRKKIKDYVEVLWKLSQIEKNEMASNALRNELVDIKLVEHKVFQFVEVMNNQLLDYPMSIIELEISRVKADERVARSEIPKLHEKHITKIIHECKKNIVRELKNISKEKELLPENFE